ncbi:MAG TPA: nitroreductase [Caulobacteraceae bacterium]|jgi:nitroreductase|nr:nitroreductase [Caulobacteraceae bacterium]
MKVSEAVERRVSVRAFRPDPVPGTMVREIIEAAARSPSGGNLQPWRVFALAGEPLARLKAKAMQKLAAGLETPEYDVYPPDLWDPFRTRRYLCGEDMYATIDVPRENRGARLAHVARNVEFFGAPVGLFFFLDRKVGPPQWSDVGMYMQTVMLLAIERGLDTCAQEFWARLPRTVGEFIGLPEDHMLFSGMAMGFRDESAPINSLRTRREPFEAFAEMRGF